MKQILSSLKSKTPWIVIGLVFLWAVVSMGMRRRESAAADAVTIRIAHWQLEAGAREGLAEAAAEYEKLHPHVRIIQEAIPESTYGQWMSTQLMGGTAPDIVQAGMVEANLMTAFFTRYLLPLSSYVTRPNPYNGGTDLEKTPLLLTFKDGMRRSFIDEVQEFMTIPLALVSLRLFYNKSLLKRLTGSDEVPTDYRAFLRVCEEIRAEKQPDGQPYVAIAGSRYHFVRWEDSMMKPLTYGALRDIDFNRDGRFSKEEMFMGFASGKIGFSNPAYRASFEMVEEIAKEFPSGWTGLGRDEAIFNFAQQKAVFTSGGIYEAGGIQEQASGRFELGVVDFPVPARSDPEYGSIIQGPRYEQPDGSMPMAVTRTSRHPDVAVDFLLFLTSRHQNEKFNKRLKWIPIILGAEIDPFLRIFEPNLDGVFPAFDPTIGAESVIKWSQLYSLYQIHQMSYEDLADQFTRFYTTTGREDFREFLRNRRRAQLQDEQLAVGLREAAKSNTGIASQADWIKYRNIVVMRQMEGDKALITQGFVFTDPKALERQTFYKYTPKALDNIRKSVGAEATKVSEGSQ
jgi:ABC-type glycerol-3-phosphate transport system substrate-binding protein